MKTNQIERYINIQALISSSNEIIPVFDSRIKFHTSDDIGNYCTIDGKSKKYFDTIECNYDILTQKVYSGIELNYYIKTNYIIDEVVYYTKGNRTFTETTIIDIVYERYAISKTKGCDMDNDDRNEFNPIDDEQFYTINYFKPIFILKDGTKIDSYLDLWKKE